MFKNLKFYPKILFQHNVESVIPHRHYKHNKKIVAKTFWWIQWKKMFAFEKKISKSFDKIIAVSEEDAKFFKKNYRVKDVSVIPTGVDIDYFSNFQSEEEKKIIVFCGSMDWLPNEDAIAYYADKIYPHVAKIDKSITLAVVGKNPSTNLANLIKNIPGIKLLGWVPDIRPFLSMCKIAVVPIRIGGGTRMKIFEAMAMKKAVISTAIGAEGLPVEHDKNIIIADNPKKFAQYICRLLKDEKKRKTIGRAGYNLVKTHYDWPNVSKVFMDICETMLHKEQMEKF